MPEVILDGESVEFSGPPPGSLSEMRAALEGALSAQGRVLADLRVDGQPFDESLGNQALAPGARIVASSLALADALAQAGAALVPEIAAWQEGARQLAGDVLRTPWSDIHGRCVQSVETIAAALQRAAEVATLRGEQSATARAVAEAADAIEAWMRSVQHGDAAGVALELDRAVVPALESLAVALNETPRA